MSYLEGLGETGEIILAVRTEDGAALISGLRHDRRTKFKRQVTKIDNGFDAVLGSVRKRVGTDYEKDY
ncbi:MAG: hypothetical protein HRT71_16455 [Flavobacteriales bacterium]|nr:hypothetical protein [Flavobacteriales bacterium]